MIARTFECREHAEYGGKGWAMVGRAWADPLSGMAVAHDTLEHGPNDSGTPEDEFMALGASLFVRGPCYYANKGAHYTDPGVHLAAELRDQCNYVCQRGDKWVRDPGRTAAQQDVDAAWATLCDAARKEARYEDDDYREFVQLENLRRVRGWLRKGYRAAQRRYGGNIGDLESVFVEVENRADALLKHADVGERITVRVDLSTRRATVMFEADKWDA